MEECNAPSPDGLLTCELPEKHGGLYHRNGPFAWHAWTPYWERDE